MLFHIFTIYEADFVLLSVGVFLTGIMYCILFGREPNQGMGKRTFWGGVFCYVLSFLLVLNYSFDFSTPVVEKYFLAKKYTAVVDYEGNKGEDYYFDLIHVDSISTSADWVDVNRKSCSYYHNSWKYKTIKLGNETFMVLDKRTQSDIKHQCSFLVQKINGTIHKRITELQYSRFEKGDTFNIEKHRGILGIEWLTYR
jgi:hypothetical protein